MCTGWGFTLGGLKCCSSPKRGRQDSGVIKKAVDLGLVMLG